MKELFFSAVIMSFAQNAIAIFEPIYLFSLGYSLRFILGFYFISYILYFVLVPWGGQIARTRGYEHSILYSAPFLILYYMSLFAIPYHPVFIAVALLSQGFHKSLYWPGYHADIARFGSNKERGRELSNFQILSIFTSVAAPVFGGLMISFLGFKTLFVIVAGLILISNLPLLATPENFEPKPFSYKRAFTDLFAKEKRRKFFGFLGYGEALLQATVWPIFISLLIVGYDKIGLLFSASVMVGTIATLFAGRITDYRRHTPLIRFGAFFNVISWIARIFIAGPYTAFLADSAHRVSRIFGGIPMDASTYSDAQKSSVMRSVVFREMSLSVGKGMVTLIGVVLLTFVPVEKSWNWFFVLAAMFTLFYCLFKRDPEKDIFLDKK